MDGVTAQQRSTLDDVVLTILANHNCAQARAVEQCLASQQNASQQAADAAETVEDNVGLRGLCPGTDDVGKLTLEECAQVAAFLFETGSQGTQVDGGGAEIHLHQFLQNRQGLAQGQLLRGDATGVAVRLNDAGLGNVFQSAAED